MNKIDRNGKEEGQSPKHGNESKLEIKPIMFGILLQNGRRN